MTPWRAFSSKVWNSSCGRSSRRGPIRRNTSAGPRIRSASGCVCVAARRPSSSAATIRAAVAHPTPGICSSADTSSLARRCRDPATLRETACAISTADLPDDPLPTRIASSSDTVSPPGPSARNRSRGRSESQENVPVAGSVAAAEGGAGAEPAARAAAVAGSESAPESP